jgi:hypothetical protein
MTAARGCPDPVSWQEFFADELPSEEQERYERHLESCPVCQARLDGDELYAPRLRQMVRRVLGSSARADDPILRQFVSRLHHDGAGHHDAPAEAADLYFLDPSERPELLGILGRYEVQEVIGQGGMGVVLKAFEPALHRLVAIKVLAPALAGSPTARRRFTREARACAAVSHDHVVKVHEVQEADGLPYLVMQYVAGESLQARMDRAGPLELMEVVRIGKEAAAGLAAAHAQGLVHRDIKPANLLLENGPGRVKVTDFGLARAADDLGLTQAGVVAGTPEYMAPEQARGEPVDHRADLFSLGSVLYAMCTGRPAFRGASPETVLRCVREEEPIPVRSLSPAVPDWLETIIGRLLAKDPAQRFATTAEVAALLESHLVHLQQPATVPPPAPGPVPMNPAGGPEMSFACSGCGASLKVKAELAGKLVKCPRCGAQARVAQAVPAEPRKAVSRIVKVSVLAGLGLAGVALVLVVLSAWWVRIARPAPSSFLDVTLGHERVPGVEDSGFYHNEENQEGRFRWTDGSAKLVIPLDRHEYPEALLVHIHRPKGTWLQITVNDRRLVDEQAVESGSIGWERTMDLRGQDLGDKLVIEIASNTVVPRVVSADRSQDDRALGVRVRAIKLLRHIDNDAPPPGASLLDVTLGNRSISGVEDSGFYHDEQNPSGRHRWTNGRGRLVIPLGPNDRPRALWVQVHRPKQTWLRILVNQQQLVNEPITDTAMLWWEQTLDLTGLDLGGAVVLELVSNPLAAHEGDDRTLGVKVRGIRLLRATGGGKSGQAASFVDVVLGARYVSGVEESGFWEQETMGGEPCRWTDGAARLTVPLHGKKPHTLALSAYVPGRRGFRVQVTVNGKRLFDGPIASSRMWSCELPLSGVDLGDSVRVEIDSATFVPAEVDPGSKDPRKLGIRLKGVILQADRPAEQK